MSPRRTVATYLALAALCLAAARPVEAVMARLRTKSGMAAYSGERPKAGAAFVRCLGGLRGILADLIWMRAIRMEEAGRYYEIVALVNGLLEIQPHFASVWVFQANVLAFDFGSPTAEPDPVEAFGWIERGAEILERGLAQNPTSSLIEERLAQLYLLKLSPACPGPEWRRQVEILNARLSGQGGTSARDDAPMVERWRRHLAALARLDGHAEPPLDLYTGLRLARWHFLRAVDRPDISPGRKLLCQRMAVRCLERMGDWAAAEAGWRELYELQGREDPNRFFRDFMGSVVTEQLLMGRPEESRRAFERMKAYFPDVTATYREFLAAAVRRDLANGNEERSRQLYRALRTVEPGETRSYEEITGTGAPRLERPGP